MQLAIKLPDELGQELLRQADVQQFVQQAINRLAEEKTRRQAKQGLFSLMANAPGSVSLAKRRLEAAQERQGVQE